VNLPIRNKLQPADGKNLFRTLAYKQREDGISEVYDLDFAGYCMLRDLPIADMVETGSSNGRGPIQFLFSFNDPDGQITQLSVDYTNSESAKHADCVRRIKKAIRSTRPREG
jgi:hypothetical protein